MALCIQLRVRNLTTYLLPQRRHHSPPRKLFTLVKDSLELSVFMITTGKRWAIDIWPVCI